jgi:hypothetical protein
VNRLGALLLVVAASLGCWQYRTGYCDKNHMDCGLHATCNVHTQLCEPRSDGGSGGANDAGRDAVHDALADKGPPACFVDANSCRGETPVCDSMTHACRGCRSNTECTAPGKPACALGDGGTNGVCVECTQNSDCKDTSPVCDLHSNTCRGCGTDSDCQLHAPGICNVFGPSGDASVPLGRCVRDDETINVAQNSGVCSDNQSAAPADGSAPDGGAQPGSSAHPFCSMQPVTGALSPSRHIVIVSGNVTGANWIYKNEAGVPILVVGKAGSILGGALPAFQMSSGDVTLRHLSLSSGGNNGVEADGGTLRLDHVTVSGCTQGGGLWLNGANFDIENSKFTGNGPGLHSGSGWGGILETSVPPTGPKTISQVTVTGNTGQGITCMDGLTGSEVLVYANTGASFQVSPGCNLTLCTDAGATCGAQP